VCGCFRKSRLYYRYCENGDGEVVFQGWTRWTAGTLQVLAADLAYEASREVPLPYPHPVLSPAIGTDQLVGLPTWLWLEPGSWATHAPCDTRNAPEREHRSPTPECRAVAPWG